MNENTQVDKYEQRLKLYKMLSENFSLNTETKIARLMRPIWKRRKSITESMIAERLAKEINELLKEPITEADLIRKARQKQKEILKEEGII